MNHSAKPSARRRRTAAVLTALALAAPGSALADPGHPEHDAAFQASENSAKNEGGGGSSTVVIGGVLTGLVVVAGGLMYWREKQLGTSQDGAAAATAPRSEHRDEVRSPS